MKKEKKIIIVCSVILTMFLCLLAIGNSPTGLLKKYKGPISVYKHDWSSDEKIKDVGYIDTPEKAIEMAEKVFTEGANEESMMSLRPFYVEFDEKNKLWHVYNIPEFYLGEAHIIFRQKDGKVLACWVGG